MSEPEAAKPSLIERLRAQQATHRDRSKFVRLGFIIVGFTVLLGGIAMLVLPGPALAVIPIGLAILSLEFAWAARLLEVAIEKAEQAKQSAKETTPRAAHHRRGRRRAGRRRPRRRDRRLGHPALGPGRRRLAGITPPGPPSGPV